MPLYDILNEFQKGHSHMAVVVKYKEKSKYLKNECELKLDRKKVKTPSSPQQQNSKALPAYKYLALDMPEGYRTSNSGEFKYGENQGGTVVTAARAKSLQGMDELQYQRSKKWERSPDNVLDIEKTAAIHSFSSDEEVTGLITMEDVIEELLQEEILDETDEYIDVHARIKVNLLPPEGKDALLQ